MTPAEEGMYVVKFDGEAANKTLAGAITACKVLREALEKCEANLAIAADALGLVYSSTAVLNHLDAEQIHAVAEAYRIARSGSVIP